MCKKFQQDEDFYSKMLKMCINVYWLFQVKKSPQKIIFHTATNIAEVPFCTDQKEEEN